MTAYHIIVSIKFCLVVGNAYHEWMSGFEILEGDLLMPKTNALHLWDSVERNN